jgi:hypothetical protein
MVLVAAAGPAMNLGLAIIAALCFHLVVYLPVIAAQWVTLESKERPYHQRHSGGLQFVSPTTT